MFFGLENIVFQLFSNVFQGLENILENNRKTITCRRSWPKYVEYVDVAQVRIQWILCCLGASREWTKYKCRLRLFVVCGSLRIDVAPLHGTESHK